MLAQWDGERNGSLKPSDVSRCDPASVVARRVRPQLAAVREDEAFSDAGCPYCGRRLTLEGFNSAECLDAGILHLWHPTKNGDLKFAGLRPYGQEDLAAMPDVRVRMAREPAGDSQREPQVRRAMGEGDTISPRAATTSGQRGRTSPDSSTPS